MDDPQNAPQDSDVTASSAPPEMPSDGGSGGRMTLEEAFDQASAALSAESVTAAISEESGSEGQDSPGESERGPQGSDSQVGSEEPEPEAASPAERQFTTVQGALDHVLTLVRQGREGELTAEERGLLNQFRQQEREQARQQITQEDAEEREFREMFSGLHAERLEDPELFSARLLEEPELARFYNAYAKDHPELLEGGPGEETFDRARVDELVKAERAQARTVFREALDSGLDAVAQRYSVPIGELRTQHGGKLGTLLDAVVDAAVAAGVKAGVEKELPGLREAERKAAELEAQARYTGKTIIAPRPITQLSGDPRGAATGPAKTFEQAYEQALSLHSR